MVAGGMAKMPEDIPSDHQQKTEWESEVWLLRYGILVLKIKMGTDQQTDRQTTPLMERARPPAVPSKNDHHTTQPPMPPPEPLLRHVPRVVT